jgi:hypothetical protein
MTDRLNVIVLIKRLICEYVMFTTPSDPVARPPIQLKSILRVCLDIAVYVHTYFVLDGWRRQALAKVPALMCWGDEG